MVLWAKADSHETLVSHLVTLASVLELRGKDAEDQNAVADHVKNWLQNNNGWLLVLDNVEDPQLVRQFIPAQPDSRILLTSQIHIMDLLGMPKGVNLDVMPPDDAVEFLYRRTERDPNDAAEREAAYELAHELGYFPLALEQSGAYVSATKARFQDYLMSYRKRSFQLLGGKRIIAGEYQYPVAKTWAMSFRKVEEASEAAADLLRISAFLNPDDIPFEIFTKGSSVSGSALSNALSDVEHDPLVLNDILEPLIHYSLVVVNPNGQTYSVHRLVQSVLRHSMPYETQRICADRALRAVGKAFPEPKEFSNWPLCARLLPHAQATSELIDTWCLDSLEPAWLLNKVGYYLYRRAQFHIPEGLFKRALRMLEEHLGHGHPDTAEVWHNLAWLHHRQGRYADTERCCNQALAICQKQLPVIHPCLADVLDNLGWLHYRLCRHAEAEPLFRRALEIRQTQFGDQHPEVTQSLINLAAIYREAGNFFEAETLLSQAIDIRRESLPLHHPDLAGAYNHLARLYAATARYSEAEPHFKQVLSDWESSLGSDHTSLAQNIHNLALLYIVEERYDEAEPLLFRALGIRERAFPDTPDHPDILGSIHGLLRLFRAQGRDAEASLLDDRMVLAQKRSLRPDALSVVEVLGYHGSV